MDEERDEAAPVVRETPSTPERNSSLGLTSEELSLLHELLDGHASSSPGTDLLVDAINEKLFDLLGDTAIEFDETGAPTLVEDYVEDVREAIS